MLRNVFTKSLWDARRSLLAWCIGIALVGMMYASFYPQMNNGAMAEAMESFPQSMREALNMEDLTSAAGYLQSTTFGILVPLLALLFAAAAGARAIAGDEESGYLDLLLAHPVSRVRLLLERFAAIVVSSVIIGVVVWLAMRAISGPAELDISVANMTAMCLQLVLFTIMWGALALAIGALVGRRALVFSVTAGVGVLAYIANTVAPQAGADWLQKLSPFYYYLGGEPLKNGIQWFDAGILVAVSAVLVAIGALAFTRRDIAV